MALSRDGKVDDLFSGGSESSSNQSSRECPLKHYHSTYGSRSNTEGYSASVIQQFTKNVSNPPRAVESDTSDITRPLQARVRNDTTTTASLREAEEHPTEHTLQKSVIDESDKESKVMSHDQPVVFVATPTYHTIKHASSCNHKV